MEPRASDARAVRFYRLLLRAFPPEFRQVYGADLEAAFRDEHRHLPGESARARIRFWIATLWDVLWQGMRERAAEWSGRSPVPPPRHPLRRPPSWSLGSLTDSVRRELVVAARTLARRPAFSTAAVLILAGGLAGGTLAWTSVTGVLLAPLGFDQEDRLVGVWMKSELPDGTVRPRFAVSDAQIVALRERADVLREVAWINIATASGTVLHRSGTPALRVRYSRSSTNFFSLLGVVPALGRTFRPGDEGRNVVLLSSAAWTGYFGRDPNVVGRSIGIGSDSYRVVGVLPRDFRWLGFDEPIELWLPEQLDASRASPFFFHVVGRLGPGTTPAQAEREASGILLGALEEHLGPQEDPPAPFATVLTLPQAQLGEIGPRLKVLSGAVAFVVLLSVANVALLLLMRVADRGHDGAMRAALGGTPGQVAAPVLAEASLLTGGAWFLAMAAAAFGLEALRASAPTGIPRIEMVRFSWSVLVVGGVMALGVVILISALPAVLLRRLGVRRILGSSPGRVGDGVVPRNFRAPLVVAEVMLATILLSGAALMLRSFMELREADLGFETPGLLQGRVVLPVEPFWTRLPRPGQPGELAMARITPELADLRRSLRERLTSHPGVAEVQLAEHTPLGGRYGGFAPFIREGREEDLPPGRAWVSSNAVDPDFLPFLGVELVRGRWLTQEDDSDAQATALISEALARRFWPGEDPVGDRFRAGRFVPDGEGAFRWEPYWVAVVGVVRSLREWEYRQRDETVYRTLSQRFPTDGVTPLASRGPRLSFFVRYRGDPAPVAEHVRRTVAELLPGTPVDDLRTMDGVVNEWLREPRFYAGLLGAFGVLATILAGGGIAAVIGFGVSRRAGEIGLRVALGARPGQVLHLATRETLLLVSLGLAAGVAAWLALARTLDGLLYEVESRDPGTLVATCLLFGAVALVSTWVPARSALAVDPAQVLRCE